MQAFPMVGCTIRDSPTPDFVASWPESQGNWGWLNASPLFLALTTSCINLWLVHALRFNPDVSSPISTGTWHHYCACYRVDVSEIEPYGLSLYRQCQAVRGIYFCANVRWCGMKTARLGAWWVHTTPPPITEAVKIPRALGCSPPNSNIRDSGNFTQYFEVPIHDDCGNSPLM